MSSLMDEILKERNNLSQEEYQRLYYGEPYQPDPNLLCCKCLRSEVDISHEGGMSYRNGKYYCENRVKCDREVKGMIKRSSVWDIGGIE